MSEPSRYERINRRLGPFVSLGLGALTVIFVRRGLSFAPVALATLALAWVLTAAFGSWFLPIAAPEGEDRGRWRGLARTAMGSMTVGMYQNVLFYLVPVWFASTTWWSVNLAFPTLLAAMAVFSCFEYPYRRRVLEHPFLRTAWSAITLFGALVPAATLIGDLPLRASIAVAAALAALIAGGSLMTVQRLRGWRGILFTLALIAGGAGFFAMVAPWLPPVPIVCMDAGTGTEVRDRVLRNPATTFAPGSSRVYAWFAVRLPTGHREQVFFTWYRNGQARGRVMATEVVGGRQEGFRTWSYWTAPPAGQWRVDLSTGDGQLIGRRTFVVDVPF